MKDFSVPLQRAGGASLIAALAASILHEALAPPGMAAAAGLFAAIGIAVFWFDVGWSRRTFILIGVGLFALAVATRGDWLSTTATALEKAGFIAAFFTAMTAMRAAATGSPGIVECGRFLARQPPGRRYLALTLGGHLFGLILMYGALALLGALATEAAGKEPNAEIRYHRTRRMLVAVQRGFVSTLPWSPLAFASAITLTLIPGAKWEEAVPYCLASGLAIAAIGWGLDTIFKPRLSAPPPPRGKPEGEWLARLRPLLVLLAVLVATIFAVNAITGIRIVGSVMIIVPVIALTWIAFQPGVFAPGHALRRAGDFTVVDLPAQRSEIVLLVMAAFIGTVGGHLAAPVMAASGLDLARVPAPLLLVCLFWLVPLAGQVGMNPIMAVALIAPLLPEPGAIGVSPALVVVAITSGWALSGATSPFTASTLLIGSYGRVSARKVGLVWNGPYALVCGVVISLGIVVATAL